MSGPQDQSGQEQGKAPSQGPGERADQWAAGNKQSASPAGQGPSPATSDERTMGMLCHLLSLCGIVLPIPFANILAPLILWLIKRQEMPFVDDQGKESVNFQITVTIVGLLCVPLIFLCGIGAVLLVVLGVVDLVFVIIATVKSSSGIAYRYPINFRFIK